MRLLIIFSAVFVSLLVLVFFIIMRSTLTIHVKFLISMRRLQWNTEFYLWGKHIWTIKSGKQTEPVKKSTGATVDNKDARNRQKINPKLWQKQMDQSLDLLRAWKLDEHVIVKHVVWVTTCGTGDAAETALLSGIIWSIKASILPWIAQFCSDHPRINVVPAFQRKTLNSNLSCMFQVKIGDAIAMIKKIRGQWKEG
ncbi:DUF2953 domain-containing protein [Sporolactobacillus shoreicorticis]|uniref:DUF2953 domain-containing protein n=1 Tax=Sporolactobacillus shoreicorticis TaxID=1923877 RepID=A0ABW5RXF2_9BACL|nr:DUF2953 domain-containing protein [Sporolactobacillus shoreicorticis]MCO7124847.1 DUF2953 domain-containing protein [Sporolactobacillus shoreicorticis]